MKAWGALRRDHLLYSVLWCIIYSCIRVIKAYGDFIINAAQLCMSEYLSASIYYGILILRPWWFLKSLFPLISIAKVLFAFYLITCYRILSFTQNMLASELPDQCFILEEWIFPFFRFIFLAFIFFIFTVSKTFWFRSPSRLYINSSLILRILDAPPEIFLLFYSNSSTGCLVAEQKCKCFL